MFTAKVWQGHARRRPVRPVGDEAGLVTIAESQADPGLRSPGTLDGRTEPASDVFDFKRHG
jgi:hypothetical protein